MIRSPCWLHAALIGLGLMGPSAAQADAPRAPSGQGRLIEGSCKAKATRAAVTAAMNRQGITASRVKFVRFEYLERVRKDEFCAYTAVLANGTEPLFATFRLPGGRFRFQHLD